MNGKQQFLLVILTLLVVCFTIVYSLLYFSLWPYRSYVGLVLLALVVLLVLVFVSGRLNEQALCRTRYHHHEETPLDGQGEPNYWPQGAQVNPHRLPSYQVQQQQQRSSFYGE